MARFASGPPLVRKGSKLLRSRFMTFARGPRKDSAQFIPRAFGNLFVCAERGWLRSVNPLPLHAALPVDSGPAQAADGLERRSAGGAGHSEDGTEQFGHGCAGLQRQGACATVAHLDRVVRTVTSPRPGIGGPSSWAAVLRVTCAVSSSSPGRG